VLSQLSYVPAMWNRVVCGWWLLFQEKRAAPPTAGGLPSLSAQRSAIGTTLAASHGSPAA
jgi:hypothetical protein